MRSSHSQNTARQSPNPAKPYRPRLTRNPRTISPHPIQPRALKAFRAAENAGAVDCGESEKCRSEQRDYSDLQAQWHAAKAAEGQKLLAYSQTGLAALGTFMLVWTLGETRRANRIARETYIADQRPWVGATIEIIGDTYIQELMIINVAAKIANYGKTPAIDLIAEVHCIAETKDRDPAVRSKQNLLTFISQRQQGPHAHVGDTLFPNSRFNSSVWSPCT